MIVTPEGLNVFPEDVERVLNALAGVRDSAVVGVTQGAEERVHAVLLLEPGVDSRRHRPRRQRAAPGPSTDPHGVGHGPAPSCREPTARGS